MIRKIIRIDEEKCNGCGLCAEACHEGAIGIINGKARLLREDYCDGLGDCLPACPMQAITLEECDAPAYHEEAVTAARENSASLPCGCPGSMAKTIQKQHVCPHTTEEASGCLSQWPVQIKLVAPNAPYFNNADLLVAADCTAYAYGNFHHDFIRNRICIIGCPKLDMVDYSEKLTAILTHHAVRSVTVVRMEVPCCAGIVNAVKQAVQNSGKVIPLQTVTIATDGSVLASLI